MTFLEFVISEYIDACASGDIERMTTWFQIWRLQIIAEESR